MKVPVLWVLVRATWVLVRWGAKEVLGCAGTEGLGGVLRCAKEVLMVLVGAKEVLVVLVGKGAEGEGGYA